MQGFGGQGRSIGQGTLGMRVARQGASLGLWWLCWFSYGVLIGQQLMDAALRDAPPIVYAVKLVPLVLFLPGMLRDNLKSFVWLCFVSLLYFIVLVERVFADPAGIAGWIGLTGVVLLFCAAMLYVRARGREINPS